MIEIYRSSRIETLADLLCAHLHRHRPRSVLAPQTVLVGHLGMKRWLTTRLATQPLAAGTPHALPAIAANLEVLLPSEWLDGLAQAVLGEEAIAIAPYRRPALRWRIHELLPQIDAPEVQRYLVGEDSARRRFQLADRLAGLYGQYLVYRSDWLAEWERGELTRAPRHWQGELWRQLVHAIGQPHRAQRMQTLLAALQRLAPDPEQPALLVFGVSHLPPDALAAIEALSASRTVCIYFPDPCRELWDHLASRREAALEEPDEGPVSAAIGHPLLSTLGRIGQHFSLCLHRLDGANDLRDVADAEPPPVDAPLLQRLQQSLRDLQGTLPTNSALPWAEAARDSSLRIHSCHTRLRELEVLKDALLDQLARDSSLQPRDIVVMAPNMALYAPLVPVVFGEPGQWAGELPWQMADVPLARSHPLLQAVRELIDLPTQRITRSQVLSLLALPAVSRRFAIDEDQREALERWLARCHVAWGIDGPMKSDFGAAAVDEHSFAFGFDRMFAGLMLGASDSDQLLDDILPATPVTGPSGAALGALWKLIELLREWRADLSRPRPLAEWSRQLGERFQTLFAIDRTDADERAAMTALDRIIASIGSQAEVAAATESVEWVVVREVLAQALDGIPDRQSFLTGGITFCGMVPQRAIPFRVVALLGLNDGDYPRPRSDGGLDLMLAHPRVGDRDARAEDRYLFLEAIMSARDALHLSWIGQGVTDGKPRNPAQPLAELMSFLDQTHKLHGDPDQVPRPWLVRHPLQPFDARYFDPAQPDPRLFSYSTEFAGVTANRSHGGWRFMAGAPPLAPVSADGSIDPAQLKAFFRKPASWWCRDVLGLSREALEEEAIGDLEPLGAARERFDGVVGELVREALQRGWVQFPDAPPPSIARSGRYASGAVGRLTWQAIREEAQAWLDCARSLEPYRAGPRHPESIAVDVTVDELRIRGVVPDVVRAADAIWRVEISTSALSFANLVPLYIDWALLRLANPDAQCRAAMVYHRATSYGGRSRKVPAIGPPWSFPEDLDDVRRGLRTLLKLYGSAHQTVGLYHARTSYTWVASQPERRWADTRQAWAGGFDSVGERDYAPGYNRLLAGEASFLDPDGPDHERFARIAESILEAMRGRVAREEEA